MRALIVTLLLTATAAHAGWFDSDCQELAERSAAEPAAGVTRVVIIGRAGFLHVEGRAGVREIRATGRACAPIEEFLVGVLLKASRAGSVVTIEAIVPKKESSTFASETKLDFTVTLPAGMPVDVADTSGDLTVSDVGNARVADSSGSMLIRHVRGNLTVRDTSGDIDVDDVSGDFTIEAKTSGRVDYKRVSGRVTVPSRYRR
jgi:hypothetical protein